MRTSCRRKHCLFRYANRNYDHYFDSSYKTRYHIWKTIFSFEYRFDYWNFAPLSRTVEFSAAHSFINAYLIFLRPLHCFALKCPLFSIPSAFPGEIAKIYQKGALTDAADEICSLSLYTDVNDQKRSGDFTPEEVISGPISQQ